MTEGLLLLAPVLIGYLLGSIPFGFVIVKAMRGIDIREYGSHNIGATNVLRVVGWFPALLTLLGDVGKGAVPPLLATLPLFAPPPGPNPWIVVLAPMAAIWGHAYSAFFYLKEKKFARGKAVATGLGAVIGFVAGAHVSWIALAAIGTLWFASILLPKLFTGRFGWVSLSSLLAAVAMPIAFELVGAALPFILFGAAAAAFVLWKHKENIGRLLDGVEPRLGERVPLARVDRDEVACAFMIHAITPDDWWQTRRFSWAVGLHRHGLLPLGVIKRLMLLVRPIKMDTIRGIELPDGRTAQVHLICVPWLPDQIKAHPKLAVRRAIQAAHLARDLGARCLGLGAYWSVVGNKGQEVAAAAPFIPITNGGAYTAGTVRDAVPLVFGKLQSRGVDPDCATAAVVGANGVVGFGICRQLAGKVARLVMVGTDAARLERSAAMLRRGKRVNGGGELRTEVDVVTDVAACREAHVVFTATSSPTPVLRPEHVEPNAVIYDLGRPADVHPSVLLMAGVTVVPGGVVRPPGPIRSRVDTHFGEGCIPACMAETVLIALDECYDRVSLGDGTRTENMTYFVELADRLGFRVVDVAARPEPVLDGMPAAAPAWAMGGGG
jgi:acyl-phosphate glycerol 3-phosphate acyltransferase